MKAAAAVIKKDYFNHFLLSSLFRWCQFKASINHIYQFLLLSPIAFSSTLMNKTQNWCLRTIVWRILKPFISNHCY